jgi:hypothetical protein
MLGSCNGQQGFLLQLDVVLTQSAVTDGRV